MLHSPGYKVFVNDTMIILRAVWVQSYCGFWDDVYFQFWNEFYSMQLFSAVMAIFDYLLVNIKI
jgi:hypothetical protein